MGDGRRAAGDSGSGSGGGGGGGGGGVSEAVWTARRLEAPSVGPWAGRAGGDTGQPPARSTRHSAVHSCATEERRGGAEERRGDGGGEGRLIRDRRRPSWGGVSAAPLDKPLHGTPLGQTDGFSRSEGE